MPSVRTTAVVAAALAVAAATLAAFALQQGCTARAAAPVTVPSDVHLARVPTTGDGADPTYFRDRRDVAGGAGRLAAARTVATYCGLLDEGQLARAGELCARRRLWSRRALGTVTRFRFRSARVYAAPDARTLVLKARVHVHAGRGCPLPDGLAVVFFTLGRAGSTVGGWLITAVSTRP